MRRRDLLVGTPALGLTACRPPATPTVSPPAVRDPRPPTEAAPSHPDPFQHGVASGDPLHDRVILWTRLTAPTPGTEIETRWVVADDPGLFHVVAHGVAVATAARDHTIKLDVTGLSPGRAYYYRFEAMGHRSAVGRTRTLPAGSLDRLRLAFTSCSNYPYGYFNAYAAIARRPDLHAVLHLGDYLYEYANGVYGDGTALSRIPDPAEREILTLADYRSRHAIYKTDPDLQELHRQHPMIAVWDDHELANDAWWGGAQNHQEDEGSWVERRAAAVRAYREWMPIRELHTDALGQIQRSFRFGDLLDLVMLDTRLVGRDRQEDWRSPDYAKAIADPRRSLLGRPQEAWLAQQLERSRDDRVAWRVLGQQVMMGQLRPRALGDWINADMWDGYPPARRRLLDHVAEQRIEDLMVLTGDIHSSWAYDLARDPLGRGYDPVTGKGSLGVEFVTPAVSSPSPVRDPEVAVVKEQEVPKSHPHLKWLELRHRGYVLLDIDRDRTVAEWHHVASIDERSAETTMAKALATARGKAHLEEAGETAVMGDAPAPAPND